MSGIIQSLGIDITQRVEPDCATQALAESSEPSSPELPAHEQQGAQRAEEQQLSTAGAIATGASTFVLAYAVHKCFAPVRIATTLTATPFIVRFLRAKGVLRAPKTS